MTAAVREELSVGASLPREVLSGIVGEEWHACTAGLGGHLRGKKVQVLTDSTSARYIMMKGSKVAQWHVIIIAGLLVE